ncbi:hypothetical protein HFN89_05445 [Rhizobium laguerreae]|nr:hypothetical protein [Rhizobium laguerreae]
MTKIRIERVQDSHECDTCGFSAADGARVFFDDVLKIELHPVAACFDGVDFDDDDIYREILRELGTNVVFSTEYGYFGRVLRSFGHQVATVDAPGR